MKKAKGRLKRAAAALMAMLMVGSAAYPVLATGPAEKDELKIAVLSDTHYLSPDMIKDTADYTEHLNSDRKMFTESSAILEQMLETIRADQPDVLMISGDLTKDGEKEGHEALAARLEALKQAVPGLKVYVVPGNHDLRNANAMNFNTEDGAAVPAGRTEPEDFKEIYNEVTYGDESIIAAYTPPEGKEAGGLSYAARPAEGYTVIAIDSARYSADNTDSGLDEHETSGAVSVDLEKWILEQIAAAKSRGDTVIGLQHHGYIPHFTMEPELLPMYLVNDYERLSTAFADAGMSYVFTGHMHANDIAAMTTEAGSTLYDIETGSVVTYPSPMRFVTISRSYDGGMVQEQLAVETKTHLGPITFTNPVTGREQTIEDVTAYGQQHGFSNDMLSTTVNGFLNGYYRQIAQSGGIKVALEGLLNDLLGDSLPIGNITVEKLVDAGLPLLLPGADSGEALYYDTDEGGIVVKQKVSILNLNVVIPSSALKQTLNVLLEKIDNEVLANPALLDAVVEKLVSGLTAIPVAEDKTLLDYANYIYQSHLAGADSGDQPEWVAAATKKIENGELLEAILQAVIADVADVANQALANLPLEDVLGATAWNNTTKEFVAAGGRTPLVRPLDKSGENALSIALGVLGAKWPSDSSSGETIYSMPEGSNPEVGYSVADFLNALKKYFELDIGALLDSLINGTPADPEEGTEATEGLLTAALKGQINTWLAGVVASMGEDANYPADNDTVISSEWRLSDRTGLNAAIAEAEKKLGDSSRYTDETVDVLRRELEAAAGLAGDALQAEVNLARERLESAIAGLAEKPGDNGSIPDGNGGASSTPDDSRPGGGEPNINAPQTGEGFSWASVAVILSAAAVAVLTLAALRRRNAEGR